MLDMLSGRAARGDPRRELEMNRPELSIMTKRLNRFEEQLPDFVLDLPRQILVVEITFARADSLLQILRQHMRLELMSGKRAERLDVEGEVSRCPLRP